MQQLDINDAFEKITLSCFDEYPRASNDSEGKPSFITKKYEHPYKSKKKKRK
jgi:hypothetical protein